MRMMVFAAALALQLAPGEAARISQAEFKKLVAAHRVVIVDTRTEDAFQRGHIPGAILLPLEGRSTWPDEYAATVDQLKAAKKPIVTYCA
jgi:rhodanese-related sulfurtransferase